MVTINPYLGVSKQKGYKVRMDMEYNRTHIRRYAISLNKRTDKEIIRWLEKHKPYQTAIKNLILEQIKNGK